MAGGYLSGKYRKGQALPASQRASEIQPQFCNDRGFATVEVVETIAGETGAGMSQVALAWMLARPGVTAPISGANTVDQFAENLGALEVRLSPEQIERLDSVSAWE